MNDLNLEVISIEYYVPIAALRAYKESLESHILYVQQAGRRLGVDEHQLEAHDRSKYSMEEFPFYAMHFHGPGDADGFARAWLHHMNHNPHHWQHWIFPDGFTPKGSTVENGVVRMPDRYALEMIADWYGASKTYTGSWDMSEWLQKNMPRIRLHSETALYVRRILENEGYGDLVYRQKFAHEMRTE